MPEKPRVKAPKKRTTVDPEASARKQRMLLVVGGAGIALIAVVVVAVGLLGLGGGGPDEEAVRADLVAAGCTLQAVDAEPATHSLGPDQTVEWNTDPPTNGPHYGGNAATGDPGTVIWNAYTEPLQLARVVHNLEHGGAYIFYGDEVSDSVVEQLRAFYDDHRSGTLLAPLPRLGNEIALGAWVVDGGDNGYLAKCKAFDENAFSSFFDGLQFRGPERFDPSQLQPGHG